jgi:hypothetical protein
LLSLLNWHVSSQRVAGGKGGDGGKGGVRGGGGEKP